MGQLAKGSSIPSFTLAGQTWPAKYAGLKVLVCNVVQATGSYSCMRTPGSSTDYVVPANKTFKCIAGLFADVQLNSCMGAIGYADTAATFGGAAAPTNPVFMNGGTSTVRRQTYHTAGSRIEVSLLGFNIPTGKYPFGYRDIGGESQFYIIGYEE